MGTETKRARQLREALESRRFTGVRVTWEPVTRAMGMCGPGGGWIAETDQRVEPLGLNFAEAIEHIKTAPWLNFEEPDNG